MARKSPFTSRLRKMRFEHGELTQEELAKRVGVTRQTIIALEADRYVPSLLLAVRLARVFQISVEELFALEGD
ncbi:MAG: helix-turn-helix transcriptional regulator [Longimicrobiales bacterium]|jgi:putative transcriptional regulator|nr:helix-turn-helix transcriptional regulator [Longimicrobiales bacterium]